MKIYADFHIHSRYSRATSPNMNIQSISRGAGIKGIHLMGTGDFTHPKWFDELKTKLNEKNNGIYEYDGIMFVISGEISLMYSGRKIHLVVLVPNFHIAEQINEFLDKIGRRDYDGRPIFGMDAVEFVDNLMQISKNIEIIPAHIWTPWFGLYGSMSGFDSIYDCFKEKTKYIHALETGLSSDPPMNWMVSETNNFTLVSNSDSHSPYPWRIGREANIFELKEITYDNIIKSIRSKKVSTIEVDPSYGKYHYDGHRSCGFSCSPEESKKLNNICPKCGKPLTIGVLHRVYDLADKEYGFRPKDAQKFYSVLPLYEIISHALGVGLNTKRVSELAGQFLKKHSELDILFDVPEYELASIHPGVASMLIKNRDGELKIRPGYDGVYGNIEIKNQTNLKIFK